VLMTTANYAGIDRTALRPRVVEMTVCPLSRGQIDHALGADRLLQASLVRRASWSDSPCCHGPDRQSQDGDGRDDPQSSLHGRITSSPIFVHRPPSGIHSAPVEGAALT